MSRACAAERAQSVEPTLCRTASAPRPFLRALPPRADSHSIFSERSRASAMYFFWKPGPMVMRRSVDAANDAVAAAAAATASSSAWRWAARGLAPPTTRELMLREESPAGTTPPARRPLSTSMAPCSAWIHPSHAAVDSHCRKYTLSFPSSVRASSNVASKHDGALKVCTSVSSALPTYRATARAYQVGHMPRPLNAGCSGAAVSETGHRVSSRARSP
eukprot:SAG25_NODE_46_length_19040_cov_20.665699_16_plen_218_part_00